MLSLILLLLKLMGVVISGFFGVYALLHDYRGRDGIVTGEGRLAMRGVIAGALITATFILLESWESRRASEQRAEQFELQMSQTNAVLGQIGNVLGRVDRVANRVDIEEATINLIAHVSEQLPNLTELKETLRSEALWPVPEKGDCRYRLPASGAVRFEFLLPFQHNEDFCQKLLDFVTLGLSLPHLRVSFYDPSVCCEHKHELGFFRIHASNRLPPGTAGSAVVSFMPGSREAVLTLDDIPVRYRTGSLLADEDFAGKIAVVRVVDWGSGDELRFPSLVAENLAVDFSDGRGMRLEFEPQSFDNASVLGLYRFGSDRQDVEALISN